MSFFQKRPRDLKFLYIITSSAYALPIFAGLPLCFDYFLFYYSNDCIMQWAQIARIFCERWVRTMGTSFSKTRMVVFGGCFEYSPPTKSESCPKMRGYCFSPFFALFCPFFGGSFVFF